MISIILFEPEIPQNAGNIIRTCSALGARLYLVPPLGFSLSSRHFKRAGLDYFDKTSITLIEDLSTFLEEQNKPFYFFSSKAKKSYTDIAYTEDLFLIFGAETRGLPPLFFQKWPDAFVSIPMKENIRCLNLANSVAIAAYEVARQIDFFSK